uniref:Carboxypeptidase B n=1 Tax=Lepeophtheirus salmonis TaxID=72036 RepID=D3PH80_LEPSM|nr:Carboxypeptidase B [Lepeophtheirus salmonis]
MKLKILILGIFALVCVSEQRKSYNGYQVVRTENIDSQNKIIELIKFVEHDKDNSYDFGVNPRIVGNHATIMAAPGTISKLLDFLKEQDISAEVIMKDVGDMLKKENNNNKLFRRHKNTDFAIDWYNYYGVNDIYTFLHQVRKGKEDFVSVVKYGTSYEGRDLNLIKIEKAGPGAPNIFIEGGIHAREWISPSMTTYIIYSLLGKPENANYLNQFNFHIIPSANPDGYEFTRNDTRFWRKTRSYIPNSHCRGVDPNRNWGFHWHESGVSDDPCSSIYPGSRPFSEIEVESIRKYVLALSPTPIMSLCIHSAAELFLYPYGYAVGAFTDNHAELEELGQQAASALNAVHGSKFGVINAAAFWPGAGAADDWYAGVLGSRFVYTIELRKGEGNIFDLPTEEITPSGEELWEGIKVMLNKAHEVSLE